MAVVSFVMVVPDNSRAFWKFTITTLVLVLISLILALYAIPDKKMHIISCDVGQGDATLVVYGTFQILIDGGQDHSVLRCLEKYVAWWDRDIDIVLLSHADADHAQGLIAVFERYNVKMFVEPIYRNSSDFYGVLEKEVGGQGTRVIKPHIPTSLRYGLIYLDIVYPSEEAILGTSTLKKESPDLNTSSLVAIIKLKEFDMLLTGDIDQKATSRLLSGVSVGEVEYIKVPHHGSKNGLTQSLLEAVKPKYAIISVGEKNKFGHPHKEIIDMLDLANVEVHRTDIEGDVELITDGVTWEFK